MTDAMRVLSSLKAKKRWLADRGDFVSMLGKAAEMFAADHRRACRLGADEIWWSVCRYSIMCG